MLKHLGKRVVYCDNLVANHQMALGLIENDSTQLSPSTVESVLQAASRNAAPGFISETFEDIYFTADENLWLDGACPTIHAIADPYARAIAWYALFQSAISKRPYNLFHRANLNIRTADVKRSFGNKATWDRSFEAHFVEFARQANAAIAAGPGSCKAVCLDALAITGDFDLVYIDPPYLNARGTGVDYFGFYHFLEGMLDYDGWRERIDWSSKHRRLVGERSPWNDKKRIHGAFEALFDRFRTSQLAISYRSDGIPSIEELEAMLRRQNRRVQIHTHDRYRYALSTNKKSAEVLLIVE